jgi:hypothetical protein
VTIQIPSFSTTENTIKIGLGHPGESFYQGEDPRAAPDVMAALEEAGKLK